MAGTARGFGWVELVLILFTLSVLVVIVLPLFPHKCCNRPQDACSNNQRQIAVGIQIYTQDNHEFLPTADIVWAAIQMAPGVFICPTKGKSIANAYAYNINLSGRELGSFTDPTDEVMTLDSKNFYGKFDTKTGTSAPNSSAGSAANALLCPQYYTPLPNVFYAPGDEDSRHGGVMAVSYLDGHVASSASAPEADVQWQSTDYATVSYGPTAINHVAKPAAGYSLIQPHVGSAVEGTSLRQTHSVLGVIEGKVSWQFSKENVADKQDCTIGFGLPQFSYGNSALCYFAVGNHGKVKFFQNHLNQAGTAFGTANQVGSADTYLATDVFSIARNGQTVNITKNGKQKMTLTDTDRNPTSNGTRSNAVSPMQIFVFTAPGANSHNGVTNVMASGLH